MSSRSSSSVSSAPQLCPLPQSSSSLADVGASAPEPDPLLANQEHHYFNIQVVDDVTELPIAGVQLHTTSKTVYTTDNNGRVAFYEPGTTNRDVWFTPVRTGYTAAVDWLGSVGKKLRVTDGGSASIRLTKTGTVPAVDAGDLQTRLLQQKVAGRDECMAIRIIDQSSGRGIPLVTLAFPGGLQYSDSQGMVAYCNPDHMGNLSVDIKSHGYQAKTVALKAVAGQSTVIELTRVNIAERLYRTTGQGIYRDSLLLGLKIPTVEGALNGQVTGQDSVISAVYKNEIFWTWGDTNNISYPLGIFETAAGTSKLPGQGGLNPDAGVNFTYLGNPTGFISSAVPGIAPSSNPTWVGALVAVPDANGDEKLFGSYTKPDKNFVPLKKGLIRFDDGLQVFKSVIDDYPLDHDGFPDGGQAYKFRSGSATEYVYFGTSLRVPATAEAMLDRSTYESYTPLLNPDSAQLEANNNQLVYRWRKGTWGVNITDKAISDGGYADDQSLYQHQRDVETGNRITYASTSITWNEYRGRFVAISEQKYGSTSSFGETWYAEADTPMGPWLDARKIVSHDDYTFYNPYTHPYLSTDGGKTLYFEASYTAQFSDATLKTPYYDYNQIMYRLKLDADNTHLPVAIYDVGASLPGDFITKANLSLTQPAIAAAFLAHDRPLPGGVAVGWNKAACDTSRQLTTGTSVADTLFYALPASATQRPTSAQALYEYRHTDGRRAYATDNSHIPTGFTQVTTPLAYVWKNPISVKLPVAEYRGALIVNAGADQCLTATGTTPVAVSLAAAIVRAEDNASVTYRWHLPTSATLASGAACDAATGKTPKIYLPKGVHTIRVDATDTAGHISNDQLLVQVD